MVSRTHRIATAILLAGFTPLAAAHTALAQAAPAAHPPLADAIDQLAITHAPTTPTSGSM